MSDWRRNQKEPSPENIRRVSSDPGQSRKHTSPEPKYLESSSSDLSLSKFEDIRKHTSEIIGDRRSRRKSLTKQKYAEEMDYRYRRNFTDEIVCKTAVSDYTPDLTTYAGIKLGWVQGVLIPCLLNIWGVMLFLRIAWVVAQAGIGLTIIIIMICTTVCVITTLSLSAICTNGQLQGGGVYFIVSRSLGAELGASVGIMFAFANAVAASMNTIGFCESLNELLKSRDVKIIDNGLNDTRIIGAIALLVMCLICAYGMDWETKTQNGLIVIIVAAILNYIIGALWGPTTDVERAKGFVGVDGDNVLDNIVPDFRYSESEHHTFISVFAVYFPAVTGVQSGANICGDLKDPAKSIPKGTLLAIAISTASYLIMAVLAGAAALRDASGDLEHVGYPAISECKPYCSYGLHNNYEIMHMMALWGPLIYAGCWAATLSTALTNLLSVPRLIQALGVDRIYPGLIFFSKPYGRHGEPYRGYVLVFIVSLLFLLIADLNTIAPLITNFYLASYALINFCTFHAGYFKPLSWRPSFRFYNIWLSLSGCFMCLTIMMIISWLMALVTTFIFLGLYLLVLYRKPENNWGGSSNAQQYQETLSSIMQMTHQPASSTTYNPQLLVMAGGPYRREWLLVMAQHITSVRSFMIVADIHTKAMTKAARQKQKKSAYEWLWQRNARAFYMLVQNMSFEQGVLALLQCAGLGRLAPNIMLLGYCNHWRHIPKENLYAYFRAVQLTCEYGMAVAIFRVPSCFRSWRRNVSMEDDTADIPKNSPMFRNPPGVTFDAFDSDDEDISSNSIQVESLETLHEKEEARGETFGNISGYKPLIFHQNSNLDAWWLYDDGGINILLSYIIALRAENKMNLRIFVLASTNTHLKKTYASMTNILRKFRINYSELTLVKGIKDKPHQSTWVLFESIIKDHRTKNDSDPCLISDIEYDTLLKKTTKYARLRELLLEHSFAAELIVINLPYPRENRYGSVSAAMYVAWLELMSRNMPPVLFVRGNNTAVL